MKKRMISKYISSLAINGYSGFVIMNLLKPLSDILQVSVINILSGEKVEENKIK